MLAAFHGSLMASRAGGLGLFFRIVDLVAVVALKWLMRSRRPRRLRQRRFILMAGNALFIGGYQLAVTKIMAAGASQGFHFRKHVICVGMTVDAGLLLRLRLMALEGMAGKALDIFLEPV